jgi:OOP family OmpA-OmpF porin
VIQADALFDFDKSVVRPDGKKSIDDALAKLAGVDLEMVIATGHTDSVGTDAYNQKLSERRAAAVKDYLVSKGIPSAKVTTIGKGESQPVATNKTAEGRQRTAAWTSSSRASASKLSSLDEKPRSGGVFCLRQ